MPITVIGSLIITYAVIQTVIFLLLIRFVDLYEREPISILGIMTLWGAVGATSLSAIGNVAVGELLPPNIKVVFGSAISAPVVEELAKGAALVVFLMLSVWAQGRFGIPRFEGVTDGIVYGAAIGLGFAFTEDILYLLLGASEGGLREGFVEYLGRRDFFGIGMLHHAIYTGAFGVGLGLATWSRRLSARLFLPLLGLASAVLLHAINNGLVRLVLVLEYGLDTVATSLGGSAGGPVFDQMQVTARQVGRIVQVLDYVVVLAFAFAIQLWLRYQRRVIRDELAEEADRGLISNTEWELIPSYWRRSMWYWHLIKTGQWERWRLLKRIHNELVNFALLKRRLKDGDHGGEIERRRQLIAKLKAQKVVFL